MALLEAVGPDRVSFRWAYRDLILAIGRGKDPYPWYHDNFGFGPDDIFIDNLKIILYKHPKICGSILLELLGDPHVNVQTVATEFLVGGVQLAHGSRIGFHTGELSVAIKEMEAEIAAKLLPMLRHPRSDVRAKVAQVLGMYLGRAEPKVVLELAVRFRDDPTVKPGGEVGALYMGSCLAQIPRWWESVEGQQAVSVIAEALADSDKRQQAIDLLVPAGPSARGAIPSAIPLLRGGDSQECYLALRLLQATSSDAKATAEAVPELVALLRRKSYGPFWSRQIEALKVLKALGPEAKAAAPAVRELAEVNNADLRTAAVDTLKAIAP